MTISNAENNRYCSADTCEKIANLMRLPIETIQDAVTPYQKFSKDQTTETKKEPIAIPADPISQIVRLYDELKKTGCEETTIAHICVVAIQNGVIR